MISLPACKILRISAPAKEDLKDIAAYTKSTWGNQQKQQYINQIGRNFDKLCLNTNLGKPYRNLDSTLYSYLCQKHIIFYRINENTLNIIRVLHQNMDAEEHLN